MKVGRWVPTLVWSLAILFLTSIPSPQISAPKNSDKVVHFAVYAVLGFLAARAANVRPGRIATAVVVVVCITVFGAIDEWHQAFIPGRFPSVEDWVADSVGGLVGSLVVLSGAFREKQTV